MLDGEEDLFYVGWLLQICILLPLLRIDFMRDTIRTRWTGTRKNLCFPGKNGLGCEWVLYCISEKRFTGTGKRCGPVPLMHIAIRY